jgi:hypothetical protein
VLKIPPSVRNVIFYGIASSSENRAKSHITEHAPLCAYRAFLQKGRETVSMEGGRERERERERELNGEGRENDGIRPVPSHLD